MSRATPCANCSPIAGNRPSEPPHPAAIAARFTNGLHRTLTFLSLITIVMNLWLSFSNGSNVGGWAVVFLCFLPMCFFFVGAATSQMQREVLELRRQVAEMQANKATAANSTR